MYLSVSEVEQKKEAYFGRKMDVEITELGYTVNFPDDNVKLFCVKKIIENIVFNLKNKFMLAIIILLGIWGLVIETCKNAGKGK